MSRGGSKRRRRRDIRLEFIHPSRWEVWFVIWAFWYLVAAGVWLHTRPPYGFLEMMCGLTLLLVLPTALITLWVRRQL